MSSLINDVSTFIQTHESTMMVASAWVSREWHQLWPSIKMSFPYIRDNGGLWGLFVEFIFGKKPASNTLNTTPQNINQQPSSEVAVQR